MKKYFFYWLALCAIIAVGCQKELSFEGPNNPAEGSLQADVSGDCLPKTVNGVYEATKPLVADSNTITVSVNVTTPGTYVVTTDTVNGYFFRATGIFTTTGINTVKLRGNGTPFTSGVNNFVVTFDSTVCDIQLTVLPAGAGGPAQFTIQSAGTPASCSGATPAGTYIIGSPLNSSNTVTLSVNVTQIGTYNVSTTATNGMTFSSGAGAFISTGVQPLVLTGSGTPTGTPGAVTIPVTAGSSTCNFSVTTVAGAAFTINCSGVTVNGTYQVGTNLTAANTIDIPITVTTAGPYNISASVNGMTFTGSGNLTLATTSITLDGSGTPLTATGSPFSISVGTPACSIPIPVVPGSGGSGNFLRCKIDGVLVNFNTNLVGLYVPPPGAGIPYSISVQGDNSDVPGSPEEFWVNITNPTAPTTGLYNNRTILMGVTDRACQIIFYPTGFPNQYWSSSVFNANTSSVNLTAVSTTSASGTFSGTIHDTNGGGTATKQVTEGEFQITF